MATTTDVYGVRNGRDLDNLDFTSDKEIDQQLTRARKERGTLDPGPLRLGRHQSPADGGHRPRRAQRRAARHAARVQRARHHPGRLRRASARRSTGPRAGRLTWTHFSAAWTTSTRLLTSDDKQAIEDWYERTIGEVPRWVTFLAKHDPTSLKAYRGRWERTFRGALPKQMMPYLSIRHNTVMGDREGLREAVLLGKAWGMTDDYIVNTIMQSVHYFTGIERLNMVDEVLQDVSVAVEPVIRKHRLGNVVVIRREGDGSFGISRRRAIAAICHWRGRGRARRVWSGRAGCGAAHVKPAAASARLRWQRLRRQPATAPASAATSAPAAPTPAATAAPAAPAGCRRAAQPRTGGMLRSADRRRSAVARRPPVRGDQLRNRHWCSNS